MSAAAKAHPKIQLRMGVHSGPINRVTDVNDQTNVAGAGINIAQRVMDCGDAGHILLSKHIADDLSQYRHWKPYLHDLGECAVKHGQRLHIVNLCKDNWVILAFLISFVVALAGSLRTFPVEARRKSRFLSPGCFALPASSVRVSGFFPAARISAVVHQVLANQQPPEFCPRASLFCLLKT